MRAHKHVLMNPVYNGLVMSLIVLGITACSGAKKQDPFETTPAVCQSDNKVVCEQQKTEKQRLERERQEKSAARFRKLFVTLRNFHFVRIDTKSVVMNLLVDINNSPKQMLFTLALDGTNEVSDTQDKTTLVQDMAPDSSFWISAYKFTSGNLNYLALEERLMRDTNTRSESASQFVLINLDQSLGNKALLKSQFEFQSRSDLQTWAKKVLDSANNTPSAELATTASEVLK